MDRKILEYYAQVDEVDRLSAGIGQLEYLRTVDILLRILPPPPARVIDVGGGPGIYANWLQQNGYEVHLLDLVQKHAVQARTAMEKELGLNGGTIKRGDARALPYREESADAVLCLGPLYHLQERQDRLAVLAEAKRVLKTGGVLAAAAVTRFASFIDGLVSGYINDDDFVAIVREDLDSGRHIPSGPPEYWTTAYFHRPEELVEEICEARLTLEGLLAVEGPAWIAEHTSEFLALDHRRDILLEFLRTTEGEMSLIGASAHFLAVAHKTAALRLDI